MQLSEAERARRYLSFGVLLFRWISLAWMTTLAFFAEEPFERPLLAWGVLGAVTAWTVWLSLSKRQDEPFVLWVDLGVSIGLLLVSGLVVSRGDVLEPRPVFASMYPAVSALAWGLLRGPVHGLIAGYALGVAYVLTRPINGVSLGDVSAGQLQGMASVVVIYVLVGGVMGLVSRLLQRSASQVEAAVEEAIRARERAARLAERESLARQVHDSVLQVLALIHKRGRELGQRPTVSGEEVLELASMAEEQEQALRALILRNTDEGPAGEASLREALESVGRSVSDPPVTVTAVGPVWLSATKVTEVCAAVREALGNVSRHAEASRAFVYAQAEDGWVVVSVRDDGRGFVYDEERLRADGRAGLLKSMKGRIEDLGGSMRVESRPGTGTEVEFRIPVTTT